MPTSRGSTEMGEAKRTKMKWEKHIAIVALLASGFAACLPEDEPVQRPDFEFDWELDATGGDGTSTSDANPLATNDVGVEQDGGMCSPGELVECDCPGTDKFGICGANGECDCPQVECSESELVGSGAIVTSLGNIQLDDLVIDGGAFHGDRMQDPCVEGLWLDLQFPSEACSLTLEFGLIDDQTAGLIEMTLNSSSSCTELDEAIDARFVSPSREYGGWWFEGVDVTPGGLYDATCLPDVTLTFPTHTVPLVAESGKVIEVGLADLVLSGTLRSELDYSLVCESTPECRRTHHELGDGWCGRTSTCREGYHDGCDGACVPRGSCSDGCHDAGDGTCLEIGVCLTDFHDGGSGACVAAGLCSEGFRDDGVGDCVLNGLCAEGYRDGGDGTCVPTSECTSGFHDLGDGSCGPHGSCALSFHDGGDGVCVQNGLCSIGFRNGGDGVCAGEGECSEGFHEGGVECLLIGLCNDGFHDGGDGECAALGACSAGFHDGGDGVCVVPEECSDGFHDGGGGSCAELAECNHGFHDGGDGTCLPSGMCVDDFHLGGTGVCLPIGTCEPGFHNAGNGTCLAEGCASGYLSWGDDECFGWRDAGRLRAGRVRPELILVDEGSVMVIGGSQSGSLAEQLDLESLIWRFEGSGATARSGAIVAMTDSNRVFAIGGTGQPDGLTEVLDSIDCFDFDEGRWQPDGELVVASRFSAAAGAADGTLFVTGGEYEDNYQFSSHALLQIWDAEDGEWWLGEAMSVARAKHTASLLPDGRIMVTGGDTVGEGSSPTAEVEIYDPDSDQWIIGNPMAVARFDHLATVLLDGRVLVTGGFSDLEGSPQTAEIFDPSDNSWTERPFEHPGLVGHSAVLLPDGQIAFIGGAHSPSLAEMSDACTLLDPDSWTWNSCGSLSEGRAFHAATLTDDWSILVAGGADGDGLTVRQAEIFSSRWIPEWVED